MSVCTSLRFAVASLAVSMLVCAASAQDKPAKPEHKPGAAQPTGEQPQMTPEMEACIKAGTPGENHRHLDALVGTWKADCKWWMPESPEPMLSEGTCENSWVLSGRYIMTKYAGTMMGESFEGVGYTGYDNINQQFAMLWMDSMSTGMKVDRGTFDAAKKTFTYAGEMKDPMGKMVKTRNTYEIVSADKHVFTFNMQEPGWPEMKKVGEIVYTRTGGAAKAGSTDAGVATNKP